MGKDGVGGAWLGVAARWLLALAIVLACSSAADARMVRVRAGDTPTLAPGEGFVVLAVDSNIELRSVEINRKDESRGAGLVNALPVGRTLGLFIAPAGRYEWKAVQPIRFIEFRLRAAAEFEFDVKPGVLNYPGDLVFRLEQGPRAVITLRNRALVAIDWLDARWPGIAAHHAFTYIGHYPDPFPAFYQAALAAQPGKVTPRPLALAPPPAPIALPAGIGAFWDTPKIRGADLAPSGAFAALRTQEGKDLFRLELVDLRKGTSHLVTTSPVAFEDVMWSGDHNLIVSIDTPAKRYLRSIRIETDAQGALSFVEVKLPANGMVVSLLPDDPDHILFARAGTRGAMWVHRMGIATQDAVDDSPSAEWTRLNKGVVGDVRWLTDGQGRLRLATLKQSGKRLLAHGQDGVFTGVMELSGEVGAFEPVLLSDDGMMLYGLLEEGRGQVDLVEYDIAARRVGKTLFSRPGIDVTGIISEGHVPIGVRYLQDGQLRSEYFGQSNQSLDAVLRETFPGASVSIAQRSKDQQQLLLWVEGSDRPRQLYHLDVAQRRAALIEDSMPTLTGRTLAPTQLLAFKGRDGLPLEAFLTLPSGKAPRPLVVFPHGGPIGVADTLQYDPEVQYLAALGYAVLRVNFRGSAGYGRAFREAGHRQYGAAIEDDVDAAIEHVAARFPVDTTRMCVVGTSYGGYSALTSAVRWPERFRCVASIAGISDLILFLTASDGAADARIRKELEELIGDPNVDAAAMQATSPLYRYAAIRTPVFLAHGTEDMRVDLEHTRRMARMLELAGHPPVGLLVEGEGHGMSDLANQARLWEGVAGFLQANLGVAPP